MAEMHTNPLSVRQASLQLSSSEAPSSDVDNYPEGGRKAWLVVLGAWCALVPSAGLLNSLGALQAWTSSHQLKDYSESSIGWIYGAHGFFVYLAGAQTGTSTHIGFLGPQLTIAIGPVFDTHGPAAVFIPGSLGMVVSLVCLSFSQGMRKHVLLTVKMILMTRVLSNLPVV